MFLHWMQQPKSEECCIAVRVNAWDSLGSPRWATAPGGASHGVLSQRTPLSYGTAEDLRKVHKVESLAHASELLYGNAAYLQGLAQERWPNLDWNLQHVRTRMYVVKGEPKGMKR